MVGFQKAPCETPSAVRPAGRDPRWVLPASILRSSLGLIDSSVVNVALPKVQSELGVGFNRGRFGPHVEVSASALEPSDARSAKRIRDYSAA